MEKPSISFITVSLNEEQHVQRLWSAVHQMDGLDEVDIEMVLVDGGSTDGTVATARSAGFDQIVEVPGGSIPVCRNRGGEIARGDWLAYIDADCEPDSSWLIQTLIYVREGEPIVAGWPVSPPAENTWIQRAWYFHWASKNARFTERNGRRVVVHEAFRLLTTRNMLMHRSLFDTLQGFDENLPTGEDTDFVFRAYHAGMTVLADPTLQVCHHGEPATLREFYRQQTWHANRASYSRILQEQEGGSGGNAPRFAMLFLACLLMAVPAGCMAGLTRSALPLLGALPLLVLVAGPALLISWRGKRLRYVAPLCVLYFLYGVARALDLAGFYRFKNSWKSSDASIA